MDNLKGLKLDEAIKELKKTHLNYRVLYEGKETLLTADHLYNRVTIHVDKNDIVLHAGLEG